MAVATACGRGRSEVEVRRPPPGDRALSLVVASYVHVTGIDQRVTVALFRGDRPFKPTAPVQVTVDGRPVPAEVHDEGIELPYLLLRHRFDRPGPATVRATYEGAAATAALEVEDPAAAAVPFPGRPMISVATPTVADHRGVEPICTREPPCPLHDVSLDAALGERRPLALLFATPALCQSRLCGPVLDHLLAEQATFSGRIRFLHSEIYTDRSGRTLTPAVQAYHLESEPFLFLAGPDGAVRDRLDNAYDRAEVRYALARLVGPA